jgi:chromosome segregation ATPase
VGFTDNAHLFTNCQPTQLNAEAESVQKDTEKTHFELKTEHDRVKSTLDSLQTTHDSLKSAHDDLGRSLAETQSSSGTLQRDLEAANKGRQAAELRVKEVEDALTASSASVISLKKQLDAATKRVEQGAAQRKGLKEDNEGLMSQLEEMRTRLSEVMQEKVGLVEGVQEGERMRAELEEVKSELERVRSEREGLERDLEVRSR